MKHPNLSEIEKKLRTGNEFRITRDQYIRLTGIDIPQGKSYTEKRSSVAKKAAEYNYVITVIPETLIFTKKS